MKPLLVLHGVEAAYGSAKALFGVDLRVDEGQVVALMGRNGMGKSTTILTIMRMLPLTGGSIFLSGRDMAGLSSHRAARAGLGLVPEGRRCFAPLTVAENLSVAARPGDWTLQRALDLFPRLGERMGQAAQTLSGGEQQMLAIARALLTNPRLLLLDEATEGLAPIVRQEIWAAIRALKRQGMSILLVDKSLAELRAIADRAVILERGASAWSGRMTRLDDATAHRFLGV